MIDSPFLTSVKECKVTMRKLRKKIHKKCPAPSKTKQQKDTHEQILTIFRHRQVPEFVADTLKKRRNFDLNSIKNIIINTPLPLEDIRSRARIQEQQTDALFADHKLRMAELRRKAEQQRNARATTFDLTEHQIYSSTNEDEGIQQLEESFALRIREQSEAEFYGGFEAHSKEALFTDNYLHLNESSLNCELPLFNF